jgi:hypothetical protein
MLPKSIGQRIQGRFYDYSCIEIAVDGGIQPRIVDIKYSQKLEPGEVRGTSAMVQGLTRGTYSTSGSFSIYKEDYELMKPQLVAKGGGGYMLAVFDMTVVYSLSGMPQNEDRLVGCRIVNEEQSYNWGNDPLIVNVELHIRKVITNGMSAVDQGIADGLLAGILP